MSSLIQSIRIGSSALVALAIVTACRDSAAVDPPPPSLRALAANPTQVTASAEWSEVARNLVRTRQSNAFQAVRTYATLNYAQYQAVIAALADEAAHSRIFAGIHYRFDGEVGLALGRHVARHALDSDAHGHDPLSTR